MEVNEDDQTAEYRYLLAKGATIARSVTTNPEDVKDLAADAAGKVFLERQQHAAVGVVIGVGGAMASSRLLESLLFGVSRLDIITYAGVSALLVGVALLASWLPARRAARIDPTITLRAE